MIKIPPALVAPQGSPADQATRDLIESAQPLGMFIVSLPESAEREAAAMAFNNALLWAHQGLLRSMKAGSSIVVAGALP